jgi:cytochrome d ubiquinol oxidase subunit II
MLVTHGAAWLTLKAERGAVRDRARLFGSIAAVAALVLFAGGFLFAGFGGLGYHLAQAADPFGPSNPLRGAAIASPGAWLGNFHAYPWMCIAPVLGFAGAALAFVGIRMGRETPAFAGSSLSAVGIISTVGLSMFPFILPSSIDARSSLTVWNASSSHSTLFLMLIMVVVFLPVVLLYTAFAYRVMFGRSSVAALATDPDLY